MYLRILIVSVVCLNIVTTVVGEGEKRVAAFEKKVNENHISTNNKLHDLLSLNNVNKKVFHVDDDEEYKEENRSAARYKKHDKERRGPKIWDQWGKWSVCSVTCGVGKIVRWRHCVSGSCAAGEKEAQIKTCTLPAC